MKGIQIYLADVNYDGAITMCSTTSQILATRVEKDRVSEFFNELNGPGIYFLLVGSDSVYVGQTGLDTLQKRIMKTHSGNIDTSWHTVVGFKFGNTTISSNELQYIENAMCEYAHANYGKCLTTSPTKSSCNDQYRKQHYHLSSGQIHSCEQYIKDIKHYLDCFPNTIFPSQYQKKEKAVTDKFSCKEAVLRIENGMFIIEKDSKISGKLKDSFVKHSYYKLFLQLLQDKVIVDDCFTQDYAFSSSSAAAAIVLGHAANGKKEWKKGDKPLGAFL